MCCKICESNRKRYGGYTGCNVEELSKFFGLLIRDPLEVIPDLKKRIPQMIWQSSEHQREAKKAIQQYLRAHIAHRGAAQKWIAPLAYDRSSKNNFFEAVALLLPLLDN